MHGQLFALQLDSKMFRIRSDPPWITTQLRRGSTDVLTGTVCPPSAGARSDITDAAALPSSGLWLWTEGRAAASVMSELPSSTSSHQNIFQEIRPGSCQPPSMALLPASDQLLDGDQCGGEAQECAGMERRQHS